MRYKQDHRWVGIAGLGAMLLLQACGGAPVPSEPAEGKPVPVKVLTLKTASIEEHYEAPGAVRARQRAVLASKLQATVLGVPVNLGDRVRQGQLLIELDHSETDTEASRAQAALNAAMSGAQQSEKARAAAEAEAQLATATFARYQQLLDKKSVAQQEFDQADARNKAAQANLEMAKAGIDQAESQRAVAAAALSAARIRQGYTRITAPFDGFVAERSADEGSVVSPGMPLLTVEDSTGYQLEVPLSESQTAHVKRGDTVQVSIPSISLETSGRIAEMQPGAQVNSRSSLVRIALPVNAALRSGLFGRARFSVGKVEGLEVPEDLVLRQEELRYVYVVAEGRARKRLVTVGEAANGNVEILSGLSAGEQIASTALTALADGTPVEIQP
jgi:multidrug efflux pump subunit AcrA (membrane-fusion protein)